MGRQLVFTQACRLSLQDVAVQDDKRASWEVGGWGLLAVFSMNQRSGISS